MTNCVMTGSQISMRMGQRQRTIGGDRTASFEERRQGTEGATVRQSSR